MIDALETLGRRDSPALASESRPLRVEAPETSWLGEVSRVDVKIRGEQVIVEFGEAEEANAAANAMARHILASALERFQLAAVRFPENAEAWVNVGLVSAKAGLTVEAKAAFEKALRINPQHYMALTNLGQVLAAMGDKESAERAYRVVAESHPSSPVAWISLAALALKDSHPEKAIQLLNEAIKRGRGDLPRQHVALLLIRLGRWREAVIHLKVAVRETPRSVAAQHALGAAYAGSREFGKAVSCFRTALALDPRSEVIAVDLSTALAEYGDLREAVNVLRAFVARCGSSWRACQALGRIEFGLEDYRRARASLFKVVELAAGDPTFSALELAKVSNDIGACHAMLGERGRARAMFDRARELSAGREPRHLANMARTYLEEGKAARALEWALQAVEAHPDDVDARLVLASALLADGEANRTVEELRKAIREVDVDAEEAKDLYLFLSGVLVDEVHRHAEAADVARSGIERFPQYGLLHNNLAYAYLMDGRVAEAGRTLDEAPPVEGTASVCLTATRGLLSLRLGKLKEGMAGYRKALEKARKMENWRLASAVVQKMHLEVARYYLNAGMLEEAAREIMDGLVVAGGKAAYKRDLGEMKKALGPGE